MEMFQFYANLLSVDAKYTWNKIVKEQMESDPFKDLQGISRKGPRGLSCESFNDCMMFHLLIVFPNNAAELEKYYLSNVFKKPQRISIRQFVQHVPRAAQRLCCAAALLVQHLELQSWYDTGKCFIHRG